MKFSKILIVDDEKISREQIKRWLRTENYDSDEAENGENALTKVAKGNYSVVLLDVKLPDISGFDVLKQIKHHYPDTCVIIFTAYGDTEITKRALREGADDFFDKPIDYELLLPKIESAIENFKLRRDKITKKQEEIKQFSFENIIGQSPKMWDIFNKIKKVAQSDSTILILGESGTGKELIASAIHHNSLRADKKFVVFNCAAVVETIVSSDLFGHERGAFTDAHERKLGKLEHANNGTIFFDEIAELSQQVQTKFLRFLQERKFERLGGNETLEVDVRVLAATNKDLEKLMNEEKFRNDLYFRLNVFPIQLPPLRERKEDIPLLVEHIIQKSNSKLKRNILGIKEDALDFLMDYHFPGNIRELENIIERAVLLAEGEFLTIENLPSNLGNRQTKVTSIYFTLPHAQAKEAFEKDYIEQVLKNHNGNISQACKFAGMDRTNFKDKMKKYGISRPKSGNQDVDED